MVWYLGFPKSRKKEKGEKEMITKLLRMILGVLLLAVAVPAKAQIYITNVSGAAMTNQPVSIEMDFSDGQIAQCVQPSFVQEGTGGVPVAIASGNFQTDVKNRWTDGSLKSAVVSFIVPSLAANTKGIVGRTSTPCSNAGFLTQAGMLAAGFNFDAQIQLTGIVSHNISARAILSGASSIADCTGTDPDGTLATSGTPACYWLKGPVVTAVILEDRAGRSFDVNTDGLTGNPLHPIFEAWFYPQTNQVEVGYTLENIWASATTTLSARDQTYSYKLMAGNSPSQSVYCSGTVVGLVTTEPTLGAACTAQSETVITRTRWHHRFCANGTGLGKQNSCLQGVLNVDHNWGYLSTTKLFPNWDPNFFFTYNGTGMPTPGNFYPAWTNNATNRSDVINDNGSGGKGFGFYPGGHSGCGGSFTTTYPPPGGTTGDGCNNSGGFDQGGSSDYHGPLTTWDIVTLLTSDPNMLNFVTPGNADSGGNAPFWFREADTAAAIGVSSGQPRFFNSPSGTISPTGRGISINARTQFDTSSGQAGNAACNTNFPSEYVLYGGAGQDLGNISGSGDSANTDTSHWPELAYTAYHLSGFYAYYEEMVLQATNAAANTYGGGGACYAAAGHASWRQGAIGYGIYNNDQDREIMWGVIRELALGATSAVDGSPEQTYFLDKLDTNLAVIAGQNSIPCPTFLSTPNRINYCGTPGTLHGDPSAWSYGNTIRTGYPYIGSPSGTLYSGSTAYIDSTTCSPTGITGNCTPAFSADSNFMNAYTAFMMGWVDELGLCPHNSNGVCPFVQWESNHLINIVSDPTGPGTWALTDYVIPTLGGSSSQGITNDGCASTPCTVASGSLYPYYGDSVAAGSAAITWPRPQPTAPSIFDKCADEGYGAESLAGLSYGYSLTSTANSNAAGTYSGNIGYSGTTAYLLMRQLLTNVCAFPTSGSKAFDQSPKWDIVPRP
jgi:hypothetical protein